MEILYLLIPLSLILLTVAIFVFRWALKNKQYDDMDSPAYIPLFDDKKPEK